MIIFGCTNRQIHFRNGEIHSFDSYPKLALVLCPGYHLTYPILPSTTDQLHKERAVTWRIFQALPNFCPHRQTDTMFALIYKIAECESDAAKLTKERLKGHRQLGTFFTDLVASTSY
jgi:hypothetical protein